MTNKKLSQLMLLLEEVTPIDLALAPRDQLLELSDLAFTVSGDSSWELERRGVVHQLPREEYAVN